MKKHNRVKAKLGICCRYQPKIDTNKINCSLDSTRFSIVYLLVLVSKKSISLSTPRLPVDVDKVIAIAKDLRKIELVVEFERK